MIDDAAKKTILARRMRFVAAALASAGVIPACHEADAPVVVVPTTTESATAIARPVPAPTSSSLTEGPDERVAVTTPGLDVDTDGDGVPDAIDACPNVPGAASPTPNYNGCPPMPCLSVVAPGLSARIRFRPASSLIEQGDQRYITDIAAFMAQHTYTNATCVVSRAASEPAPIATQRAAALKAALVAQNVDPSRITTQTTTSDGASATCVAH